MSTGITASERKALRVALQKRKKTLEKNIKARGFSDAERELLWLYKFLQRLL